MRLHRRFLLPECQVRITRFQITNDLCAFRLRLFQSRFEFQRLLESAREQTVECTEVDILRNRASFLEIGIVLVHRFVERDIEDDRGRLCVNVTAAAVCLHHLFVSAVVRADAKFYLREVKVEEGAAGAPDGQIEDGEKEGAGMGSWDLHGRALAGDGKLPLPSYNVQEEGRVVVTITVDSDGNVVGARIHSRTNTTVQALRTAALNAAKRAKFNAIGGVNNQEGTITYYFKLK